MVCCSGLNRIRTDFLTVRENCYDPVYTWIRSNQTSLQDSQLRIQCDRDFWGDSEAQKCNDIRLTAESSKGHPFLYGTFEFVAKLPVDGFSSGGFNLVSMNCQEYPCSMPIRGSTAGFSFWKVNPRITSCFVYYVDARSSSRVWLDIRDYTWPTAIDPTSFRTYQFIWTPQYFACLVDGTAIANFTNQLSIPKEKLFTRLLIGCDDTAPNRTVMDEYELHVISATYSEPLEHNFQDLWNGSLRHSSPPAAAWKEHWEEHVQLLNLFAYDDHVAVYFDELLSQRRGDSDVPVNRWLFEYVGQVWRYAEQRFGPLSQRNDSRFYTVFHVGRYNGCHLATQVEATHDYRHVLDCGSDTRTLWSTNATSSRINVSWGVSSITILFARGVYGNPMQSIDQFALRDMVRYDMCRGISDIEVTQLHFEEVIDSPQSTPRANSFWLRDFYLPLYNSYGQTTVLKNYFDLLSANFPTIIDENGSTRYAPANVTLGVVIHFWSGAANTSVKYLAAKAFGWSVKDGLDFRQARKAFPNIRYAGGYDDILQDVNQQLPAENGDTTPVKSTVALSTVLGITIPVTTVILTSAAVACWWYQRYKRRQQVQSRSHPLITRSVTISSRDYGFPIGKDLKPFVVSRNKLQQSTVVLGKGEFGTVYAAVASGLYGLTGTVPVAAKVLTARLNNGAAQQRALFEKEVGVMIKAGQHLNLVNLLGIVLTDCPTLLLELCELGSLLSRLVNCRLNTPSFVNLLDQEGNIFVDASSATMPNPTVVLELTGQSAYFVKAPLLESLSTSDLVDFAYQVCRGLEFLSLKSIVHRDIAARNVLLTKDRIAKVSDFGMARLFEENYVQDTAGQSASLPVRWMAPEAITSLSFNERTDVWSYGVLLWEMFSLGLVPYSHVTLAGRVTQFAQWLAAGNHLEKPPLCPNNLYDITKSCWTISSSNRPQFRQLRSRLEEIISTDIAGYYTKMNEPYQQYNHTYLAQLGADETAKLELGTKRTELAPSNLIELVHFLIALNCAWVVTFSFSYRTRHRSKTALILCLLVWTTICLVPTSIAGIIYTMVTTRSDGSVQCAIDAALMGIWYGVTKATWVAGAQAILGADVKKEKPAFVEELSAKAERVL
ncbi:hypothetical protein RvY_12496 [Ramazzottius varieornatus]|uniref:Protein kinase domain-containing protein n=1 Tax=Ramazzottius varieornatus TaxID=947166 RepID=A0A1D1VJP5_RAMVA|nr:hypothetical protein RvY_12496 [Ramazzottius varieornatus]